MIFVTNSTAVLFIIISLHDQKPKRARVLFENVGLVGLDLSFEKDREGQVLIFLAEADNHVTNGTCLRCPFGDLYLIALFFIYLERSVSAWSCIGLIRKLCPCPKLSLIYSFNQRQLARVVDKQGSQFIISVEV